ncbi:MAG TPA: glycerate kinase, partial [Candidatus Eremiobacteraceae bacterium]|nr:glycerate kinase [Candidatus Eremiobacteraceae bacterium]
SPEDVIRLDRALSHFADVVAAHVGTDLRDVPGAGAAGGTGFGFLALAGASLVPGARLVLDALGFERRLDGVDLVVTGEGRLDRQTKAGKAPLAVAKAARARGIPAIAVAGTVDLPPGAEEEMGFSAVSAAADASTPVEEAMRDARSMVADAAERAALAFRRARGGAPM